MNKIVGIEITIINVLMLISIDNCIHFYLLEIKLKDYVVQLF